MEVIALGIILGIGSELNKNAAHIEALEYNSALQQKWIEDLENHNAELEVRLETVEQGYFVLAGKHSALAAENTVEHETLAKAIEKTLRKVVKNEKDIFYVEEKIKVLHP